MNEKERSELKEKLMDKPWTEDLHYGLKELNSEDASAIADSLTAADIYRKVNIRRYQEDYIADYLQFLWGVSEKAFWRHLTISLDPDAGILWSDNMFYVEKLCESQLPSEVMSALLQLALCSESMTQHDILGCIVKRQVQEHAALPKIKTFISKLDEGDRSQATDTIDNMVDRDSPYRF